jgi:hypothetical protein
MADTLSTVSQFSLQRDTLITRALRIIGAVGQGEVPTAGSNPLIEGTRALHDLVAELQTDGMPLWKISTQTISFTSTKSYTIGLGATINTLAPLKIIQAWVRNTAVTPNQDQPILIVPEQDYNLIGSKDATGQPNQLWYQTPSQTQFLGSGLVEPRGTIFVYPSPDANTVTNRTLVIEGQYPFLSTPLATDVIDFPPYWNNAIVWGLAKDLCYEYGVGPTASAMIAKRAAEARANALSFGTEEGSLFMRPTAHYDSPTGSNSQ